MPKFIAELQTACNVWEVHLAIRYDTSEPTRPNQPYLATGRCEQPVDCQQSGPCSRLSKIRGY